MKLIFSTVFVLVFSFGDFALAHLCLTTAIQTECSFYCVKSAELGCNHSNYLSQFGYRYCSAYLKDQNFSPRGKGILAGIRTCLIQELQKRSDLTCDNVKAIALNSHGACYKQNHFCELSFEDKVEVFAVARNVIFDPTYFGIVETILQICQ